MAAPKLTPDQKEKLKIMRQRIGPPADALRAHIKQHSRARKAVRAALADGPRTVPQIAQAAGIDPADALWHLTAMRKYGELREAGQDGDYVLYELLAKPQG